MKYKVIMMSDCHDCETCGSSYADGYRIENEDGEIVVNKTPVAHCFGGDNFSDNSPYYDILMLIGVEIEEENHDISEYYLNFDEDE